MENRTDYDLQRKLIEINRRYERGELTYYEWIDARTKAGATEGPTWSEKGGES